MSARFVPADRLCTILDEAEADCTVERFHEWYRAEIAAEIRQTVPRPKADKWDVFGNRSITYRFNEACTNVVRRMWACHRKLVRERIEAMINAYEAQRDKQYGDELMMQAGGSTKELVTWILKQIADGTCQCTFQKRDEERKQKLEAATSLLSGESFAQWVTASIDGITESGPSKTLEEAQLDNLADEVEARGMVELAGEVA